MSYHCSQALVEEFLAANCLDTELCAALKSMRTAEKSCYGDKKKKSLNPSQSGTTCEPSTVQHGVGKWISLLPDSPVSPSVSQESDSEPTTNGTCGLKQSASLAKYDLDSHSWRTYQGCLFQDTWGESLETFPKWGTIVNGGLSEQMMLAHPIEGNDSGLWPTPTCHSHKENDSPSVWDRNTPGLRSVVQKSHGGTPTRQTYPTPNSADAIRDGTHKAGNPTLGGQIRGISHGTSKTGQLNPSWVEWLMGWPIGWTDLKPLEMDKFQKWLRLHGRC